MNPDTMRKIAIWPDGCWCELDYLDEYAWKSDDFKVCEIPADYTDEDVEDYVLIYNNPLTLQVKED